MLQKITLFLCTILCISLIAIGCSAKESLPESLNSEESIKQIIINKGENYNFLRDEAYMDYMKTLATELVNNKEAFPPHYAIGNLDGDNIPELALFQERNPENMEDEGNLEIYKFNGEKYVYIDKISMNYDNTNYHIKIGKISEMQNGLFLNNQVGAHSGITYGFILKDGKLQSILNEDKLSLISIYTGNEIKDIDNDGILEFSVFTVDPETSDSSLAGSDKMTLWYKWNGKDSADLIKVERTDYSKENSDKEIFNQAKNLIQNNFPETFKYIDENKDELSKFDNTKLLMEYISKLDEMCFDKSMEIDELFVKYQKEQYFDYLFDKYGLSIDKLNSLEYLRREKVLKDEEELKAHLIDYINLGYKLYTSEGMYYYLIDYQKIIDAFSKNITNEYNDYLKILALDTNQPFMNDGSLTISMDSLAERILMVESFKMLYPYSDLLPEIKNIYNNYIYTFFFGDNHDPNFNLDTFVMKDEIIQEYKKTIEKYEYTSFANIIRDFMEYLKANNNVVDDEIRAKLEDRLD